MMKTILAIFCLVIILTLPVASQDFRQETIFPEPIESVPLLSAQSYDPLIETIIGQTNLDSLIAYVRILSGEDSVWIDGSKVRIQHRVSDLGNDLAADYIKKQLETYNLEVYDQIYSADGRNIYAIQPGYLYPEKQYIICAHYDAVDDYGADDNASGVAAVLEAARILSQYDFKYSLIYAFWDEEEIGLIGSRYYASQAHSDQSDIQGVLNIDMIGWDGNNDGLIDIHTRNITNSNSLANTLNVVNSLYDIALNPAIYNPGTWQSDHSVFWDYGYGAILLIEAFYGEDLNPYYHSSEDRIGKFNLPYFHNLARLSIGAISTLIEVTDDTLIAAVIPDIGYQNSIIEIEIHGYKTNFADALGALDVWLSRDSETIIADSIVVYSNTSLTAYFSIPLTATPGLWDVNVETSIDGILTIGEGFQIFPPPTLINVPADIESIQGGINLANPGDTVLVQPGIYVENINFNGKNIVVGSLTLTTGDTSYISQTVIDGRQSGSVVTFESREDSTSVLSGFTITNGRAAYGGGIYLDHSHPKISHVNVSSNLAFLPVFGGYGAGGGIYCENSNLILTNVKIKDNVSQKGGGIFCENSNPILMNVVVNSNDAGLGHGDGRAGGGIFLESSSPTLVNVIVSGNTTDFGSGGGGIYCNDSSPSFSNVTITRNTADAGGGISFFGSNNPSFDPVNRCNIYLNQAEDGNDLYYYGDSTTTTTIVVDTFTVMNPTDYYASPISNFVFDILNAKVEQVNSDLFVNPNGDDSNSGLSPAEPLKTINFALMRILADSLEPHTIYLANGEYSPSTTGESYPLNMRNYVSLSGESESGVILCADSINAVISFYTDRAITIEYLTITGGKPGIACLYSSPSISNVTITENRVWGIICQGYDQPGYDCSPSLSHVTITENSGDGIEFFRSSPNLSNLTITKNSGNGIICSYGSLCLVNTILWNNSSQSIYLSGSDDEVHAFYSDIQGGWVGQGNIDADPMFVDTSKSDLMLQAGSPCIDAGIQDTMFIYNNGQDTLFVPAMAYIGSAPDMGAYEYGDPLAIEQETINLPIRYTLCQNYPNPFNPSTTIKFQLPNSKFTTLKVFNILGKEVATLISKNLNPGNHTYQFDGNNLASGIYYYQLVAGEYREVKKMILLK